VGIHRLLHSFCCFLNTNTVITGQLIGTARTLEAEWRATLRGSVGTGTKEDESSTGRVWTAEFHHVTPRSRLARVCKLMKIYFFNFPIFYFSDLGQPRILNPWTRRSTCILFRVGLSQNT
jgi:hypothetical protein